MDINSVDSVGTAFVAGLVTSLHCAGMCGPLACVICPKSQSSNEAWVQLSVYHFSRVCTYALIGGLLGLLGQSAIDAFNGAHLQMAPWALVVFFVAVAAGADKWLPKPKFLSKVFFRVNQKFQKLPKLLAGGLLGMATPFLPCGPLYLVFGLAMVMGSPAMGAQFLFAFGLGTLPLLVLVQMGVVRWGGRLSPSLFGWVQRGMALCMAVLLVWRLRGTMGGVGPVVDCPFCP